MSKFLLEICDKNHLRIQILISKNEMQEKQKLEELNENI